MLESKVLGLKFWADMNFRTPVIIVSKSFRIFVLFSNKRTESLNIDIISNSAPKMSLK